MRLPFSLRSVRPSILIGAAVGLLFLVGAVVVLATSGGGGDNGGSTARSNPTSVARGILADTAPTATATSGPAAEPTAPPEPNRADCAAIQGTPYQSDTEREWFHANCSNRGPVQTVTGPQPAPGAGQAPTGATLIIPSIGVNAPVWRTAVGASGAMADPTGYFNVLQYDFSANWPGLGGNVDSGNIVLAGHVDSAVYGIAVFYYIKNLRTGDTIQYRTADGRTVNYVVTNVADYTPSANWDALVSAGAADMTLITCTGTWNAAAHEYSHRRVVQARKA